MADHFAFKTGIIRDQILCIMSFSLYENGKTAKKHNIMTTCQCSGTSIIRSDICYSISFFFGVTWATVFFLGPGMIDTDH